MLTIGFKQIILILIVGFLLFGNLPKRYKELKEFFSSSTVQNDVKKLTKTVKEAIPKGEKKDEKK